MAASTQIPLQSLTQQSAGLNTDVTSHSHSPSDAHSEYSSTALQEQPVGAQLDQPTLSIAQPSTSTANQSNISNISANDTQNSPDSITLTSITTPSPIPSLTSPVTTTAPHQATATNIDNVDNAALPSYPTSNHDTPLAISKYWGKPIAAFIVYTVTLGIAFSASTRYTFLGRVSASFGTWFLNILAKAGDITFAIAVADASDCLAWGKLKKRQGDGGVGSFGGMRLTWFLALVSSTSLTGLFLILWDNIKMLWRERGTWLWPDWDRPRRVRERWRRWRYVRWSFARLVFVMVMIPGPGIILMANIGQKDVFFDTRSMTVTAGLGTYNPELATSFGNVVGPDISRLAQMMLRDRSITWPVKAVDPACKASNASASYLIAGPYRTVQPWPFTIEEDNVDGFRIYNAPFYQVDMWNVDSEQNLTFSESKDCNVYGGINATTDFPMLICIKQHDGDTLVAGWNSCQTGYSNSTPPKCLDPASNPGGKYGWTTYLHFYRRTATVTFTRSDFTITSADNLSSPRSQNISTPSLYTAINAMLYRPNNSGNDARFDLTSQPYVLTQTIAYDLWMSLYNRTQSLTIGKDWLRNVLTLPVYLYQPTVIGTAENFRELQDNGTRLEFGLPAENTVRGSYGVVDKRSIPDQKTVIAYACVAGVLLVFVFTVKVFSFKWRRYDTTEFPLVDYQELTTIVDDRGQEVSLLPTLQGSGRMYADATVLEEMRGLRIGLRE